MKTKNKLNISAETTLYVRNLPAGSIVTVADVIRNTNLTPSAELGVRKQLKRLAYEAKMLNPIDFNEEVYKLIDPNAVVIFKFTENCRPVKIGEGTTYEVGNDPSYDWSTNSVTSTKHTYLPSNTKVTSSSPDLTKVPDNELAAEVSRRLNKVTQYRISAN